MIKRNFSSLLLVMLIGVLLFSCTKKQEQEAPQNSTTQATGPETLAKIQERGALKVGLSQFNPWAMLDKNGEWIGFEVDVARKLAQDLGVELELVPTQWAGIIPALLTNKFDIIIGGMTITEQRQEQVSFTKPYEYSKMILMLRSELKDEVKSLKDMNSPKYKFALRAGGSPAALAEAAFPRAELKRFDEEALVIQDILNGQSDATIQVTPSPAILMDKYPGKFFIPEWAELNLEEIGFALPKNVEKAWLDYLNQWIDANWANKFLEERAHYWFETRDWQDLIS